MLEACKPIKTLDIRKTQPMKLFILLALFIGYSCGNLIVDTEFGKVKGIEEAKHFKYLGIPFASPPVGNLRFASPIPPTKWTHIYEATKNPAGCPQKCILPPGCKS
jgi:hypothetical protein